MVQIESYTGLPTKDETVKTTGNSEDTKIRFKSVVFEVSFFVGNPVCTMYTILIFFLHE